jgi:DNA-binding protein Fis
VQWHICRLTPRFLTHLAGVSLGGLLDPPIKDIERDVVLATLSTTKGNRTVASRVLGFSVRTLRNKITEYSADGFSVPKHESRHD